MTSTRLSYLAPLALYDTEKAFAYNYNRGPDVPPAEQTNLQFETHDDVPIYDARSLPKTALSFDKYGFRFQSHPSSLPTAFAGGKEEVQDYCDKMTRFVKEEFGGEHAVCCDFRARCNEVSSSEYKANIRGSRPGRDVVGPPIMNIHVDQTQNSGIGRIRRYLSPDEATKYLSGKYRSRIINVWRPINRPSQDCPLAFCAAHTIGKENLVPVDRYNPEFVLELYYLKYAATQEWYWIKDQRPEEIALFCQFDSEGIDLTCPHSAFLDPNAPEGVGARESLEVRIIVFNAIEGAS
ncbi:hypothetical protein LTR56_007682 [Elasticomyces elasticus]|nr:hypothetical protein LTR56_007682 [Elasticomyces elasticus]KAK3661946.1 hypothetical protein LTR22_007320 [Elasticomyces elasticus]KAK4925541.1 hypothetical protein LTR49_007379 [Elasticomyces elasticus]KAK5759819.1 hypothetical protein LTS12_010006 [Elasticomyces elasticus]